MTSNPSSQRSIAEIREQLMLGLDEAGRGEGLSIDDVVAETLADIRGINDEIEREAAELVPGARHAR